ncbi:unnamed protein product [Dibothriocephalus latus]|uniref:Uncharacterized protein n=1 Tax=Dibothriocephalus latus TaxID=60516 RepID=A0A3P7PDR9_DIBLA|nr:unnamed protein product [Dibothriocephalus latus]
MKQFVQKTSFTALYNLRPGTTYVICVSSNVGRLHFTCATWRTNQNGLDTEQVERNNAFQIPAEVGGLGDTWTLIVWKPAKAYERGRILAPEAYLLLAQQMGSQCPDQMIEMIQTTVRFGCPLESAIFPPCVLANKHSNT